MSLCTDPAMIPICAANPGIVGADLATQGAGRLAQTGFEAWWTSMAESVAEAFGRLIQFMVTFWVDIPTPTLSGQQGPVAQLQHHLAWYMALAAMAGLLVGAGKLALETAGDNTARHLAHGLTRWFVLTTAGTAAVALATTAGDAFSSWIIERSGGGNLGAALAKYTFTAALIPYTGPTLIIILGVIAIVGAFVQALLMFTRGAMLVLLAGVLPLAAAVGISGGTSSRQTVEKIVAWLVAFVLYKPVAAIVYATAFWTTAEGDDATTQITGIFMIILSTAALPALMRLVTPAVSAVSSGGGGGSGAGAAAGTAAATGARLAGSGGARGSSSKGPSAGRGQGGPGLAAPGGATGGPGGSGPTAPASKGMAAGSAAIGPAGIALQAAKAGYDGVKGAASSAANNAAAGPGSGGSSGSGNSGQDGSSRAQGRR